ncbi:MAG: HD domain-containing phosphohydrolase [Calditerrivibrio sp.]|uniref:HD domain-containing phosphohydrolase n=1 Tax=Calditerrivibrio sp. TaxID=2792612 RepID=UPI003D110D80
MEFLKSTKTQVFDDLHGSYVISSFDLAYNISKIIDLVNPELSNHHHRVAYISAAIASSYGLNSERISNTVIAALIHDIGVMLESEFNELSKFEISENTKLNHSNVGAFLIDKVDNFKHLSNIISKHHLQYNKFPDTEDEALIIHLADRIDILLKRGVPAYYQRNNIKEMISSQTGKYFKPDHVDAFMSLYDKEFFWLDIEAPDKDKLLKKYLNFETLVMDKNDILAFTNFLSHIIDFRCSFTATHSAGVASVASKIGELFKLPDYMVTNLKIAGYLHDMGKLAINPYIINKNGQLSVDERIEIKKHTYYTFYALNSMDIFENIKEWAAFHHEYLDGSGYPFHLTADRLDLGSRIMTIADIYTAISEDRPYRKGLDKSKIIETLLSMARSGKIDGEVVNIVIKNIEEIENVRKLSQLVTSQKYHEFKNILFISSNNLKTDANDSYLTYDNMKSKIGDVLNIIHFEEIINSIDDLILILNKERRIVFANSKVLTYFNKPLQQMINRKVGELFDCINGTEDQCGTTEFCKNCFANNSIKQSLLGMHTLTQCTIEQQNLQIKQFNISTIPLQTDKGDFVLFILKDIDKVDKYIINNNFYSDVINIVGNTYSILEAYKSNSIALDTDLLEILSNNISLIYQEVETQRFISLAEQNNLHTHFEKFPVSFIEKNLKNIFSTAKDVSFQFVKEIDEIFADKIILNRIIINLVKNAIEAGDEPRKIKIKFCGDGKNYRISVHNPEYIPEEIQKKIFKTIFTTKKNGNGLGTYCIKLLTERYLGGKVSFISNEQFGTSFFVEFPDIANML